MKKLFYKIAKRYVDERDKLDEQKQQSLEINRKIEKEKFDKLIDEFKKKYINDIVCAFKKTTLPQFEIGEIVTTHWYGPGNLWDGSAKMLQAHTPFKGPIDVEITSVLLDYCEVNEIIDELKDRGEFDNKYTNLVYSIFKRIVDDHRRERDISWAYMIKVPNDDNIYWRYSLREDKFLKRKSDIAKWSKKCYANELEASKLWQKKHKIDEKIRQQLEKITNTKIIIG